MTVVGKRIEFEFPYNKILLSEIKSMKGAKWHGYDDPNPRKIWSISDCARNRFQIAFLTGVDVYGDYDKPLLNISPTRTILRVHQVEMFQHMVTRERCIVAGETGVGKTLSAIEAVEHIISRVDEQTNFTKKPDIVWIGPRSALAGVKLEFRIRGAKFVPRWMTYDRMRISVEDGTMVTPDIIIFDESSKLKTPTAKRSQAAADIVERMEEKSDGIGHYVFLMSGTPAPKDPTNWWMPCEIAKAGFLKEGDINKLKQRMALIENKESISGGVYPELITWLDDERKCAKCGELKETHNSDPLLGDAYHAFVPSVNEVTMLYKRLQGLVCVKLKKDCLDLPEKQFRKIILKPSASTLRAASIITRTSPRAIQAITLLRELSDGFQYEDKPNGTTICSTCNGTKEIFEFFDPELPDEAISDAALQSGRCIQKSIKCPNCNGTGEVPKFIREAQEIATPKEQLFVDLLDEYEPLGRFVTFAGFEASIDRCVRVALKWDWDVIRVDGRGWSYISKVNATNVALTDVDMLARFQDKNNETKLVFIGNPSAAGMGITLTASPAAFYYSNTYNGEDRLQSMDRIHRMGMDINRGATIIDCIHLTIDQLILDNVQKKIDLQALTMGDFSKLINDLPVLIGEEYET